MKLSTKVRYAIRAMLELALHYGEGPVSVKEISKKQGISSRYLEHLIVSLQTAGLVKTIRGKEGGCVLARHPSQIKIAEVVSALEGPLAVVECVVDDKFCPREKFCVARDVWIKVREAILNVLNSITLQDMIEWQKKKLKTTQPYIYYI